MTALLATAIAAAVAFPFRLYAQERLGPEFQVNTYTTSFQWRPAVATDAAGNFVVVWQSSGQDGDSSGIFAQQFASNGARLGSISEFQVNTYTTYSQLYPAVAREDGGGFAVVWRNNLLGPGTFSGETSIVGQLYDSDGNPAGGDFQVNTYTTSIQNNPVVATDATGNFVVVWSSLGSPGSDDSNQSVLSQRYDSSGAAAGGEFQVNAYTTGSQIRPSVAMGVDGDAVVVWDSGGQDGDGSGVFGRLLPSGIEAPPEFPVNTYTTSHQQNPKVAMDADGNFVVVWDSYGQVGGYPDIFGQRFNSDGGPLGAEFQINAHTSLEQERPSVAMDEEGNFVVVWESEGQDGSSDGIFGQRFTSNGAPLGVEFRVNTYTTFDQRAPSVAMDAAGNFVVVWQSTGQDGSGYGIFGQRFRFGELEFFIGDEETAGTVEHR